MAEMRDKWAAGTTYEDFMGRWSRRLAPGFLSWLGIPAGAHWLDVGCGTGALADAICSDADPASVVGCDPAAPFIEYARARTRDPRLSFVVAGAGTLPRRPGGYDSITSLLALNFVPDPVGAVGEMRSLLADGGTVSACVWDYAGGMQFLRYFWDAVKELDPKAGDLDEGVRFPLCHREALEALFHRGGLSDVRCGSVEIATPFSSFEDYWRPFLGGTGPAPTYVSSLDGRVRNALEAKLAERLPRDARGTLALGARAWVVRGGTA